jgi:hypothetical protein
MAKDKEENWVTPQALAAVFGVSYQQIHRCLKYLPSEAVRRSAEGRKTRVWVQGPAFVDFWVERAFRQRRAPSGDNGDPDIEATAGLSPALERYREARADHAELDLQERQRDLLPRERVHKVFLQIGRRLRDAGEQLQREHGAEAHEVLVEAIGDAKREIAKL